MKKTIAVLLCMLMIFTTTACQPQETAPASSAEENQTVFKAK